MLVRQVMTRDVCTVTPETQLAQLVQFLVGRHISGAPVVNAERHVVGIVTEGDLVRRYELGTDQKRRSLLKRFFEAPEALASDFVRTHARRVADIMTREVTSVAETDALVAVAEIFEQHRIRRVPVVRNRKLVGIVSRADLVRALADRLLQQEHATPANDREIAKRFRELLHTERWADPGLIQFSVHNGVIELSGLVDSEEQRQAARVAAETIPGVRRVDDRLVIRPPIVAP
jgi:CBS domain-containing protein